jgi:hypothetical protein
VVRRPVPTRLISVSLEHYLYILEGSWEQLPPNARGGGSARNEDSGKVDLLRANYEKESDMLIFTQGTRKFLGSGSALRFLSLLDHD